MFVTQGHVKAYIVNALSRRWHCSPLHLINLLPLTPPPHLLLARLYFITHRRHNLVLWTIRIIPGSPYFPCSFSMAGDKTLITLFAFPLHLIEHSQQQSERSEGEGCAGLLFYCYSNAPQTAFWMAKLNSGSVRLETESILAEHTQEEGLLCVQLCAKHTLVPSPAEATLKMSLEVEGSRQNGGILPLF